MTADQVSTCRVCDTPFIQTRAEQAEGQADRCPMCRRLAPAPGRQRGIVKWYSRAKGYGFITTTDGKDIFLHKSGLREGQTPCAMQLVEFALTNGPRGIQAEELAILAPVDAP